MDSNVKRVWEGHTVGRFKIDSIALITLPLIIKATLAHVAAEFYLDSGEWLFGENHTALYTDSVFSGSSRYLFKPPAYYLDNVKSVGDIDTMFNKDHKESFREFIKATIGRSYALGVLVGVNNHGNEISTIWKVHEDGDILVGYYQIDFEAVSYHINAPAEYEAFLHSSDWTDLRMGFKGLHHKILLNAVATVHDWKFSITHGLRPRDTKFEDFQYLTPPQIAAKMFGRHAGVYHVSSVHGICNALTDNLVAYKGREFNRRVAEKFAEHCRSLKGDNEEQINKVCQLLGVRLK